jgi:hypothetical protein
MRAFAIPFVVALASLGPSCPAFAQPNQLDLQVSAQLSLSANTLALQHSETVKRPAGGGGNGTGGTSNGTSGEGSSIIGVLNEKVTKPIGELGLDRPGNSNGTGSSGTGSKSTPGKSPPKATGDSATSSASFSLTAKPAAAGKQIQINAVASKLAITVEMFSDETAQQYDARRKAFETAVRGQIHAIVQSLNQSPIVLSVQEDRALLARKSIERQFPVAFFEDNKQKLIITITGVGLIIDSKIGG